MIELHNDNSFEFMKGLEDNSFDFVLTDPPYDFTDEQIRITEKFASNHNKLIGAIYYYII